ncbi:MAG: DUF1850 domain-containing protein [Desulfobacula sp.]|jgi:hypothetical protein|uniref:DUF1850 domain-containing protein n=1 Tax=Desulfobacula sp. TaxID=2593537 RepID=UPI001D6C9D4C|nr:DUF1850 domain-containing protein [Desulfobacula sp.]MBT5545356.1 DUF1850 domain-containing protein [Desulfobacula sp.]MBT7049730.1 DUF1850 domain-containing protein [Desulfobacula sp.]
MTRPGSIIIFSVLGLVLSLIILSWFVPGDPELQVTLVKENKTVLSLPLKSKERFTIHYYHSVENAPIWEEHSMDKNGRIYIEEERYEKFGAGMGKMPGVGRMVKRGIYEAITDMHMPTGNFILRVGSPGVDHTIIWRNQRFNLSDTLAHKALKFSGKPRSMLYQIWGSFRGLDQRQMPMTGK